MNPSIQVLIIGYVWPEPRSSAAGAQMLQLIELCLAQQWAVTFASPAQPGAQRADLSILGVTEQSIALNCSSFDTWVHALQPALVIFDRFMMEEQFGWRVAEQCPQALRVLATADLHSLREARQQQLREWLREGGAATGLLVPSVTPAYLYAFMATLDVTQREIAAIFRSDITLLVSDFEIELLTQYFQVPSFLLAYCPLLPDAPDTAAWRSFAERANFISIGNFLHAPNWDAALLLKEAVWPLIRAQLPAAQLFVYGAYTPQKAVNLHNPAQGFNVMGWAADAFTVMHSARVCLAPLRFGAGIKGKLIDAMLCGTASVTTSIGVEGMGANDPVEMNKPVWSGAVTDSAQAFADAAVQLHENAASWQRAQQQGLLILQQRFDKAVFGAALIERLQQALEHRERNRRNNFIGAMLQHHQHKSTHYMARWIEAKNIEAKNNKGTNVEKSPTVS
ncbi:MAG: glycosyltransferase [Verrucomicrobiaceae bacterium]|nr:glycosyltransferase [Verrucomicrobiaceae bacterium]